MLVITLLLTGCDGPGQQIQQRTVSAGLYQLRLTDHQTGIEGGAGGGIVQIAGQWLVVSGSGSFHLIEGLEPNKNFAVHSLPLQVPLNRSRFIATAPKRFLKDEVARQRFRVADVVARQSNGRLRLWVSHHWLHEERACVTLRISTVDVDLQSFLNSELEQLEWQTFYEAEPCVELRSRVFAIRLNGGEMALADEAENALYLALGTHRLDGLGSHLSYAQDPGADWGKALKIDLGSGAATALTMGHRNPQGLFFDDLGNIWLTDHGPRGGDELILVEEGTNYGWPLATYGTHYNSYDPWSLSADPGRHDEYALPLFAWVPSIGVSDVLRLQGGGFPLWKGDLLVASLKAQTLHRMHIREGRVVVAEPVAAGARIRDMAEGADGQVLLWTDDARLISIMAETDPEYQE